jgi:hypothetical protein
MARPWCSTSATASIAAPRPSTWERPRSKSASALVACCLALSLCVPATTATAQPPLPIAVSINRLAPGTPVPAEFLGLSFEAAALDQISQYANRGDLVKLLRSLGPGVIRFGGITADQNIAWTDAATPKPPWASRAINPAQLQAIGRLSRRSGWKVLLTVGMAHFEPAAAAREVAAAHRALGANLAAVEIGNEPDAYGKHGFRTLPWIAQGYEEEVSEYRQAIGALTPSVPIAGPDVSGSGIFIEWGEEEALSQRPALLTGHHYPLGCAQKPSPTIELLLSVVTRGRESASLGTYMKVARNQHVPLRIDEAGSVSCGGVPGISNTFASALWATGYITQVMASGAVGINLQGNSGNCAGYTPLCAPDPTALAKGALRAQPEWYAMLLTRSLVGYRPLPTTVQAQGAPVASEGAPAPTEGAPAGGEATPLSPTAGPNLVVASFSGPDHGVQMVLVDDEPPGARPLALALNVGAGLGPGQVLRLTGPAPSATGDILLGGHAVSPDGSLRAPIRHERVLAHAGIVKVELAPSSAALVTVSPRARAHRRSKARH